MTEREKWGYAWWGAVAVVVGVPELWAAAGGDGVPWPTISGLVGHLELLHPWVALLVVAAIVWFALHAFRVTRAAPLGGRITAAAAVETLEHPFMIAAAAVALVAVPSAVAHAVWPDHKYVFGGVLYGSIALWWIVVPGWLAYAHGKLVPFPTLFATLRSLEQRVRPAAIVVAAGLVVLLIHLVLYPWPAILPDLSRLHSQLRSPYAP